MQEALITKSEELLKAKDFEAAMGVLGDLINYDAMRARYESLILTGIAYCLVFKFNDYPAAD